MKIPFGKYRGKELSEIPKDYLRWVLGQQDLLDRHPDIVNEAKEITARGGDDDWYTDMLKKGW